MIRQARPPIRRFLALAAATAALSGAVPASAASGRVLDERGQPIPEASACLMSQGAEVECATTDSQGRFALIPTTHPSIRVRRSGYMPVTVANVEQESPIVLRLAATIRVRVVDAATGRPPGTKGTLALVFPNGQRKDGFPIREAGEIVIRPVEPGTVRVRIFVDGFDDRGGVDAVLQAGETAELVVRMARAKERR